MATYRNTQPGYVTGSSLAGAAALTFFAWRAEFGSMDPIGWTLTGAFAGLAYLFSSLTVVIDDGELRFYFGPGFWTKRIPLATIERVETVHNSSFVGWGIRYFGSGWLYNVSGWDALELTLADGTILRIGTDEPEALKQALNDAHVPSSA